MGWASRANRTAQDRRVHFIAPKPAKPAPRVFSRTALAREMFTLFDVLPFVMPREQRRAQRQARAAVRLSTAKRTDIPARADISSSSSSETPVHG